MRFRSTFVTPALCRGPGPSRNRSRPWMPGQARHDGREKESGFTLVELMVVIVIIGLLATIVAINVIPAGDKAKGVKAKADIANIEGALDLYKLQVGSYPTTAQGLAALSTPPEGVAAATYQRGGYLKGKLPDDPWHRPYLYASPGKHGEADVWTYGADGKEGGEGTDADIGSWQ